MDSFHLLKEAKNMSENTIRINSLNAKVAIL